VHPERYILDPLYGVIRPPEYVRKALATPEVQRLRDVRLCNINSLSLTGAATVNRYEHAIGTAYLAEQCINQWGPLPADTKKNIVLAAAVHDIKSAPFGHSVEYVLETQGFKHEALDALSAPSADEAGGFVHWNTTQDSIYMDEAPKLRHLFDMEKIGQLVAGLGTYGPLISGKGMDLDNIDNVYRMAYHMGMTQPGDYPLALARSLAISEKRLVIDPKAEHHVQHWYETRKRVYEYLLLNPDEFSAKCMLQEAVEHVVRDNVKTRTIWHESDSGFVQFLQQQKDPKLNRIVRRWMNGNLYGCLAILATPQLDLHDEMRDPQARANLEARLTEACGGAGEADIALHFIRDVNKTQRVVQVATTDGKLIKVGQPTSRILIGVFLRNARSNMDKLDPEAEPYTALRGKVQTAFEEMTGGPLQRLPLFGEARA
jgi:HD superfamily phosphohydrolase